jgi:acetyl-CoA acetyltransferase
MDEVVPLFDASGRIIEQDDGLRRDSSVERLARLKPFFDRRVGLVTAGNSSQITDGAALLVLASERAVKQHDLNVLGRWSMSSGPRSIRRRWDLARCMRRPRCSSVTVWRWPTSTYGN